MAKWYESDEKIHEESPLGIWWMGTKKNTNRACPAWFSGSFGYTLNPISDAPLLVGLVKKSGGRKMPINIIFRAGSLGERFSAVGAASGAYCYGTFFGGAVDSLYQMYHEGEHLAGTRVVDWYIAKEKGVQDFLIKFYDWWKS